ncbi:MAG: DUF695 domain-containing protein [Polyangiaceae bacterium]
MSDEQGDWDFYYCRVDDAPASIFLDFQYLQERPALDTLYYAGLQMLDPDDHGMGSTDDAKLLWALEDAITASAQEAGFTYVGRLRNHGDWQLTFYGAAGKEETLEAVVVEALKDVERGYRIGSKEDPEWGYYHEFLVPDEERWRWIMDRRVVQQLEAQGDPLSVPREVDHFLFFPDADRRDAFAKEAAALGFRCNVLDPDETLERAFGLSLHRDDGVELNYIHDLVMSLVEMAAPHDGDYDGWGCVLIRDPKLQN